VHIAAGVHRRRPPLSLSESTDQVLANAAGCPITHGAPSRARIQSNGQRQRPHRGGVAATRPAAWPGTDAPYSGAHSPSTAPPPLSSSERPPTIGSGNVAASPRHTHREAVELHPRYSPSTPDLHFAHAEVSSPQKGYHKRDGSMAVDQRAASGRASLTENDHVAATCGGKEALRPCSPVSNTFFKHRSGQSRPRASGATTTTTIIIIIIIETGHTAAAQWPTCSLAPASAREWHFAASPGPRAK